MKSKKSSYYQVGLGDKFLFRAKIIFLVALVLTLALSGSAIYAGISSGQLEKSVLQPVKSFAKGLAATWEESTKVYPTPSLTPVNILNITNSTSTSNTNTNIKSNTPTSTRRIYVAPTYPPLPTYPPRPTLPPQKSWEESVREMDERAAQKRAENDAWFNQKAAENQALYQQRTEAAQKSQDDWWAQKQKELEEWKKQNGF